MVNRFVPEIDSGTLLGEYGVTVATGAIAATLAANATLFSVRWTNTSSLMVIRKITAFGIVSATITAAVPFDLQAIVARSFTVSDTLGVAVTLTGNNQKFRSNMATSLVADMRVANTAAVTAGTRTLDANGVGSLQGFTGTVIGTRIFDAGPAPLFDPRSPIVLAADEGLIVRAPLVGPATGSFTVLLNLEWSERTAL